MENENIEISFRKLTGSPINIYTNILKCKHKELVNILQNELNIRREKKI